MADNLGVTPGTGVTIAADDVGSIFYQRIKKARGSDGKVTSDIKFGVINCSSSGDNTVHALDASNHIRVIAYALIAAAPVNVTWKSGASTALSGAMPIDTKGGLCPTSEDGLFETAVNEALVLNLSSAVQVSGHYAYVTEA